MLLIAGVASKIGSCQRLVTFGCLYHAEPLCNQQMLRFYTCKVMVMSDVPTATQTAAQHESKR